MASALPTLEKTRNFLEHAQQLAAEGEQENYIKDVVKEFEAFVKAARKQTPANTINRDNAMDFLKQYQQMARSAPATAEIKSERIKLLGIIIEYFRDGAG